LLKVSKLNCAYGDVEVLRDINIYVAEGEIVSIVGANGAGKTTLINCISGIMKNKSGKIEFLGKNIGYIPTEQIVKLGLVQVPENRFLFNYMSVKENLELGCYIKEARGKKDENFDIIFKIFPVLKERLKQKAGLLSGGEQQMLTIARALMSNPKLIMFDEPSLGLAPIIVKQVFDLIKKIHSQGISILLAEQNIKKSLSLSNRAYVLENGEITLKGTGEEVLKNSYVFNKKRGKI